MAKVFLGETEVAPVVGVPTPEVKYGVSVNNLLPTFNSDGTITPAQAAETFSVSVSSAPEGLFSWMFARYRGAAKSIIIDGVTTCSENAFQDFCRQNTAVQTVVFRALESVGGGTLTTPFAFAFSGTRARVSFPSLRHIGMSGMDSAYINLDLQSVDEVFPVLESISGNSALRAAFVDAAASPCTFSSVRTITGASSSGVAEKNRTFGGLSAKVFRFPSLTSIEGRYIFPAAATEIHFPAASQTAIEASEGYATKWGATNATIYFDL